MTTQPHAAVPMSETPACRLQGQNIQMRDSMSSIEFLRGTGALPGHGITETHLAKRFVTISQSAAAVFALATVGPLAPVTCARLQG
jgi:hypothetical protein